MNPKNADKNAEIIPALMPRTLEELTQKVARVVGVVPVVQLDIMDGVFVPNRSWPYTQYTLDVEGEPVENIFSHKGFFPDFQKIIKEENAMPYWQDIDYELDLMIANVDKTIDVWLATGARRLVFHLESMSLERMHALLVSLRARFPKRKDDRAKAADMTHSHDLEIGIAINIHTPPEKIERFIEQIDFVQCMGIERIGFQGQSLAGGVLEQVRTLRQEFPWLIISVDGGVNEHTATMLAMAGVSRLVCGSAVFAHSSPPAAIRQLDAKFTGRQSADDVGSAGAEDDVDENAGENNENNKNNA